MLKKILAFSLSVIYLAITIGFPISKHHCDGQDKVSYAISNESFCSCATDVHELKSCCSIELEDLQHCQTEQKPDCCTHETKLVHFDLKQQLAQKEQFKVQIVEIDIFNAQLLFDAELYDVVEKAKLKSFPKPPPKTIPSQILNQEFLFYG